MFEFHKPAAPREEPGIRFDREKFKALVHYICWKVGEDPALGNHTLNATKLNKVLWLADRAAYERTGRPITGARYFALPAGPAPRAIVPIVQELEREGTLAVRRPREQYDPTLYFSITEPSYDQFGPEEISLVDKYINEVCLNHTARSISDLTHDDIWALAAPGQQDLPYFTVFSAKKGTVTPADVAWAKAKVDAIYESAQGR